MQGIMMRIGFFEWNPVTAIFFLLLVAGTILFGLDRIYSKFCPKCRERVRRGAVICRYCGAEVK